LAVNQKITIRRALGAAKPATKSFAAQQDRRVPEVSTEKRKSLKKKQHFDG
jgi:hypothetical protein